MLLDSVRGEQAYEYNHLGHDGSVVRTLATGLYGRRFECMSEQEVLLQAKTPGATFSSVSEKTS